jgi:hypothetical protein
MRRPILLTSLGVVLVVSALFAATGLGDEDPKAVPGQAVHKEVERVKSFSATASAQAIAAKTRPLKRVGIFSATQPTVVPANGATAPTFLTCPSRGLVVAGGYETDRFVTADISRPDSKRAWRFGFVDLAGAPGLATEWIVCVK